jgi:hypothetical protein
MCEMCNITQVNHNIKTHCTRCYSFLFPDKEISKNYKTKENFVIHNFLILTSKINIDMSYFVRDKIINNGCSKRRPDLYIDLSTHIIVIENDENQHKEYEEICENKRMMEIFKDFADRPIVFIRFNCDSYLDKNGKKQQSLFTLNSKTGLYTIKNKKLFDERINCLFDTFYNHFINIPIKEITIEKLYYDQLIKN